MNVFSILGLDGRRVTWMSFSSLHSKRWWHTVSYGWSRSRTHCGMFRSDTIERHIQLEMLCSQSKNSDLVLSHQLVDGILRFWKFLPVFPKAHLFIQSSLQLTVAIHFTVCIVVGMFGFSYLDPIFFTTVSALSLPGVFTCPEIHYITSLMSWVSVRLLSLLMNLSEFWLLKIVKEPVWPTSHLGKWQYLFLYLERGWWKFADNIALSHWPRVEVRRVMSRLGKTIIHLIKGICLDLQRTGNTLRWSKVKLCKKRYLCDWKLSEKSAPSNTN